MPLVLRVSSFWNISDFATRPHLIQAAKRSGVECFNEWRYFDEELVTTVFLQKSSPVLCDDVLKAVELARAKNEHEEMVVEDVVVEEDKSDNEVADEFKLFDGDFHEMNFIEKFKPADSDSDDSS